MNWPKTKQNKTKTNDQILSLYKSFAKIFYKKTYLGLSFGSHYSESPISLLPTELVQTLTLAQILTHRMQKAFPQLS